MASKRLCRDGFVVLGAPDELAQVRLAAKLRRLSVTEYIKRAINEQMRREGVDAVLFRTTE